jgi:hypothetical protein
LNNAPCSSGYSRFFWKKKLLAGCAFDAVRVKERHAVMCDIWIAGMR